MASGHRGQRSLGLIIRLDRLTVQPAPRLIFQGTHSCVERNCSHYHRALKDP